MSGRSSWRLPTAAFQYADHDYADFAQEFLRRNQDYQRDYQETRERIAGHPETTEPE